MTRDTRCRVNERKSGMWGYDHGPGTVQVWTGPAHSCRDWDGRALQEREQTGEEKVLEEGSCNDRG